MALIDILKDVGPIIGLSYTESAERADLVHRINKAARELYDSRDLVGSLREHVFTASLEERQITFPYYVQLLRGVRRYEDAERVKLNDMRPRYFYGIQARWQSEFEWRVKQVLPLARHLDSASSFVIKLEEPAEEDFTVTIVGSTPLAERIAETVTFNVGDQEKYTTNTWTDFPGIKKISKSKVTSQNVIIEDVNEIELSIIPNSELEARYTLVQILDDRTDPPTYEDNCICYEILYKQRFTPFHDNGDEFPADNYDDAVKWKVLSHYYGTRNDEVSMALARDFELKTELLLNQRERTNEQGTEKEIQFKNASLFDVHRVTFWRQHRHFFKT